jgi:hypothetical protein
MIDPMIMNYFYLNMILICGFGSRIKSREEAGDEVLGGGTGEGEGEGT